MNTKLNKVVPVLLAVVAVLAISTFQVFAHNSSENEDFSRRSSSTSVQVEDRASTPSPAASGEDFSFTGMIEAIGANSYTVSGKTVVVNAGTMLDSGLVIGAVARVEVIRQADGSLLAKEVETESEIEHMNGDDHGSDIGKIDDKGTGSSSVDDHGGSDDHGGNSGKGK